ncbi:hypothetical protein M2319_001949 [Rhodobium gokarnense]|uniref:Uncharacterized protein n=1 Tax=Rhodobium gokarnense TaxID=364296 RepID=A0ABT3HB39_9HYPH|nr:hypothetical protein [Rhodobium gokarnense]
MQALARDVAALVALALFASSLMLWINILSQVG